LDYDAAVYEPSGTLLVTSGDEIRVTYSNASGIAAALSVSVGIIFTSNTGLITINSFENEYRPK
jgi:hypothetical protein